MLSHKKPDSVINEKVEFGEGEGKVPLDNIAKRAEAYKPKERVTYKMIKEYIEAKYELAKLPARLEAAKTKKAETIAQLEIAKVEVEKPFAFEEELKEKTERLNALNIELNLNEKDTPVIDDEPEQDEETPEKKNTDRER